MDKENIKKKESVFEDIITPVGEISPKADKKPTFFKKPIVLITAYGALFLLVVIWYLLHLESKHEKAKIGESNSKASQALVKGDYSGIVDNLKKSHDLNPKDVLIEVALIKALAIKGNLEGKESTAFLEGQKIADKALKENPQNVDVLLSVGYLYEVSGHYKEAYDLYLKATQLNPKNAQAWFHKGHVLEFSQNFQDSAKDYEIAYSLDQDNPLILMAMGKVYYSKAKPDEALSLFLKAASIQQATKEMRSEALTNASIIRRDQILYMKEAIALSKQAVEADPNFSPALAAHGFNLGINGKFEEGLGYVSLSIKANPRIAINYWYMGMLYRSVKNYKEAYKFYKIAVDAIDSDNTVLGGDRKKASATIKIKAVDVFKKIGKITPKELKIILGQKDSVDTNIKQKQSENKDAIQYDYSVGKYGVKMLDDKIAYEGDMVLVNFSNGVFPMKVVRVAGNKTGEVMLIDPRKPAGSKSRGISPSLILKKQ